MPKATPQITSPPPGPPAPASPTSTVIPSILAIGRTIRQLDEAVSRADTQALKSAKIPSRVLNKAMERFTLQRVALSELALAMPPQSLGDVAVHLAEAFVAIDNAQASEIDDDERARVIRTLRHVVCGAFPVIVKAAQIDPNDILMMESVELMAEDLGEMPA